MRLPLIPALAFLVCAALCLAVAPRSASAREQGQQGIVVKAGGIVDIAANGDGQIEIALIFPEAAYAVVKKENQNPRKFLREFAGHRNDAEYENTSAVYDDTHKAVVLRMTQKGGMQTLGQGRWMLQLDKNVRFDKLIAQDGRQVLYVNEQGRWNDNVAYVGAIRYLLPPGAQEPRFDESRRRLTYTLPRNDPAGPSTLDTDFRAKERLMTAVYKTYGLGASFSSQWVAKMVFRNPGRNTIRDLKVRFRVPGYSEWSLWQKFKELVPGQTAVAPYYPVLSESVARLSSDTPADVRVEWKWVDGENKPHEDSGGQRITLLGVREFVFSNLSDSDHLGTWHDAHNNGPFLAAWVSRDDPAVKQFAAMANKNAGGVGAGQGPRETLTILKALYELMRKNNVTYQHPPGLVDRSISFDTQMIQNVKFPRDVLRDKSGTCIDLAILYAAAAQSLGIKSYLALVPGHCFPVFQLPKGAGLIGVEATGVAGGLRYGSAPFSKMLEFGRWELDKWQRDGRIQLIDFGTLWTQGISNPELKELPADILQRWEISTGDKVTPMDTPKGRPLAPGLPAGWEPPTGGESSGGTPKSGEQKASWLGVVEDKTPNGTPFKYPMLVEMVPAGGDRLQVTTYIKAKVPNANGGKTSVDIVQVFLGGMQNGELVGQSQGKLMRVDGKQQKSAGDVFRAKLQGQALVGRIGSDANGWTSFQLPPYKEGASSQPGGPGTQPPPANAAPSFEGTFEGLVRDQLENGQQIRYPMRAVIQRQRDGTFQIYLVARAEVMLGGQKNVVEGEELFTARLQNGALRGKGTRKVQKLNGQPQQVHLDEIVVQLQGDELVGQYGNDQDGVTEFRLPRKQGGQATAPAPQAGLVGNWQGQVTDRMANGQTLTYPLVVRIRQGAQGGYAVEFYAKVSMRGNQGMVEVEVAQKGTAQLNQGVLVYQGSRKVRRVGGQTQQLGNDNGRLALDKGMLVGRVGSQANGYTEFRLQRAP